MTPAIKESRDVYLEHYREQEQKLAGSSPAWVNRLRSEAIQAFADLGFPSTHLEEWKYTNVAPISGTVFQPAPRERNGRLARTLQASPLYDLDCSRLVFVNGRYAPDLSSLEGLPKGTLATSLVEAFASHPAALEEHLGRYSDSQNHPFVALNTAFIEEGAFVQIPKGVVLDKPLYLLYLSTAGTEPWASHPRNLILVGQGSQASIIEGYLGFGEGAYFTNAVTEFAVEENAVADYVKVQQEGAAAFHMATVRFHQARNSSLKSCSLALGSLLGREELGAVLDGEGAEALLNGLYVTTGRQLIDNHTVLDHAQPHCSSREFYKGVLDEKSTGVFNGKIIVRKDAQKTDSKQSDKNLLLSEDATINTKPQLEIYADDVKCTHGATIGQIDPDAIFYLRSRGIALAEARNLLVVAFAQDIIGRIKFDPLRERLKSGLMARLFRSR